MHRPKTRRSLPRLLLTRAFACLLPVAALSAQVTDDADKDLTSFFWSGQGNVRCLKLAATDQEVVAVFVQQYMTGVDDDKLMVAVSVDGGAKWKPLYRELRGGVFIKDMAVAIAHGYPGNPNDRWIYIVQEVVNPNMWDKNFSRVFRLIEGPLDKPWDSRPYPYYHVIGGTNKADMKKLDEPLDVSIAIAPYTIGKDYMVAVAHRWVDDGDSRIVVHTPLKGARASGRGTGWRVAAGPGGAHQGGTYAHPSIAADPRGRSIVLAYEDRKAGTVLVSMADAQTYRGGTAFFSAEFESDRQTGVRVAPHVAIDDNVVVMTALGDLVMNVPGARPLFWYWKQRAAPFAQKGMLHAFAVSSAPLVDKLGRVYAVANVAVDPNRSMNPGRGMAFWGRERDATLTGTRVGDNVTTSGTPTVAALLEGSDPAVFGYAQFDKWDVAMPQPLWIDRAH